jgi:ribosomal protein S18 acetylase RimI-like enzyme
MGFEVRPATPEDAEAVARLHTRSWQAAYRGAFPDDYLDSLDWRDRVDGLREIFAPGGEGVALVVLEDGEIIGWAGAGAPRDRDLRRDVVAELYAIYFEPGRWGRGAADVLLDAVVEQLPAGVRTLVLWVLDGNARAIAFYERRGFRPDGWRRPIERGGHPAVQLRYRVTLPKRSR